MTPLSSKRCVRGISEEPLGPSPQYYGVPSLILTAHIAGVAQGPEQRVVEKMLEALAG
jgi:phosphoglycerate dehydrogenase-like enzyme